MWRCMRRWLVAAVAIPLVAGTALMLWRAYYPAGEVLSEGQVSEADCGTGQMSQVDSDSSADAALDGFATLPASVAEYRWSGAPSDGETLYSIANYSIDGNLATRTYYGPKASIDAVESYVRDEEGRLIERRLKDGDGNTLRVHRISDPAQGAGSGEVVLDASGQVIERVERTAIEGSGAGEPGKVEERVYDASGVLVLTRLRADDEWGNPVSITERGPDGTLLRAVEYEYDRDSWNNWIERRDYDVVPDVSVILVAGASRYLSYPGAG